jgi:hypothetical protein
MKFICEYCHKDYIKAASRKKLTKFCSKKCHDESRKIYRICQSCGKKFRIEMNLVLINRGLYCSYKCRGHGQMTGVLHQCKCGKYVYRKPSQLMKHVYCSRECAFKYRNT